MSKLNLDGKHLTLRALRKPGGLRASLDDDARQRMSTSLATVRAAVEQNKTSYGINTGFGALASTHIDHDNVRKLQLNLVRSHACGVGEMLEADTVRRIMILKANSLAAGLSGVRPEVVESLIAFVNAGVLPQIPSRGSVGASGDLAPLAHLALALIGEGEATHGDRILHGEAVTAAAGVAPLELEAKEGLALLNGTQVSAALMLEGLFAGANLLQASIVTGALSVEGMAASFVPFDAAISEARGMRGQQEVARRFRGLLTKSEINESHTDCERVQDPYCLRCMPQVFGAVWDTLVHAASVLQPELNSVSDNPLIVGDRVLSGGNFHAAPLGFIGDFMAIAVCELANLSERRLNLMLRGVNPRLPAFLAQDAGLESGLMLVHVTSAALTNENRTLAHPASVDNITTSAGQEDHVSMAPWSGLKLATICRNTELVLAAELTGSIRAIEAMRPLKTTDELENVITEIRQRAEPAVGDRRHDAELKSLAAAIRAGVLSHHVADLPGLN